MIGKKKNTFSFTSLFSPLPYNELMAFIDEVRLHLKAGDGGDGVVRWRHEKFKPKAGPGGGDGGRGGNVYVEAIPDLAYLDTYKFKKEFRAENGQAGGSFGKKGRSGKDLVVKLPRGSVVKNLSTGEEYDLDEVGKRVLVLKGGEGGLGNEHFKSSTNTTPYEWTPGKPGEEADFLVELRLFADLGLVGLPSAGKSTLLNMITNAKSKVGAYHFTTLDPHLGDFHGYIIADIPGIIEGASEGKGLGHKFLKHVWRTKAILHLIGLDSDDPIRDYRIVRNELKKYGQGLDQKDELILLTKTDLVSEEELKKIKEKMIKELSPRHPILSYSAYDEESIQALKAFLSSFLEKQKKEDKNRS